jgi:hypothetical protein
VKVLYTALICLFAASLMFAQQEAPTLGIEEVYLAKDDGLGNVGEQVDAFATTDVPIYCVVLLDSNGKAVVKMNFVAVRVNGVKPETKVVTASYTTQAGQNRVNFTGRPERYWAPGTYRVDLFIDGRPAKNLEFEIKGSGPASGPATKFAQTITQPPRPKPAKRPTKPNF